MIDITHKHTTLREAIAEATVLVSLPETIAAVKEKRVPKGDVLEAARVAGLFGIKRTSEMIPDCHPLPIEHAEVTFSVEDMAIVVKVKVRTIYRTGVEVEAMHGASVAALTIYDMLKPIDKGISIERIRLLEKKGGKSDWKDAFDKPPRAAVLIISDGVASGKKEDKAGAAIIERLRNLGVQVGAQAVVADEPDQIVKQVKDWTAQGIDLILTTGGTGLSPRDRTPEAIAPILDREVPGIMEAARAYGQERMPLAIMSRGVAGMIGRTLVITLPGSTRGAQETMDALFPFVLHVLKVQAHAFRHGQ
ncbi:MAG: bifunctional molybdenum cofactor biosynthesis protein MoaC/MoaB [Flavobacteriales bacterium]|nr:bifunctional molybdenum cofactor biosynthesis protein MoaC/MoaB [Flavobacteriales bacterium]MBK7270423.1 bifunctional molybdenum cofactor biosynthesis protein MoaC/MoaB [Flavobacteriales bacterium]MBK7751421.1 bifunctional molybdenum cofactor biosynthesis protein MoaC/MoaB [Flavobacteriales bacterium]MBK9073762.1 bifunctional molybdenum cofactor biosynthesis protein MoaC/MoaB [Flavobacteriales bacterium]